MLTAVKAPYSNDKVLCGDLSVISNKISNPNHTFHVPFITPQYIPYQSYVDGLVQERRNSSALAMELCLILH